MQRNRTQTKLKLLERKSIPMLQPWSFREYRVKKVKKHDTQLDRLRNKVFEILPALSTIYKDSGSLSLFEYARSRNRKNPAQLPKERKAEVISVIKNEVKRTLGDEVAESVKKQLISNDSVSTAEHFVPLTHANNFNPILQHALGMFESSNTELSNVIVLACAGTSFDNKLMYARGINFNRIENNTLVNESIAFLGRSVDSRPVVFHKPYTIDSIKRIRKLLITLVNEKSISKELGGRLKTIIDNVYATDEILQAKSYTDQITKTNFWLWKEIFSSYAHSAPNLVFISQEHIVLELIKQYHLYQDTLLHKFIFDPQYADLILQYFDGITGAFSSETGSGTYLFWALPQGKDYRLKLIKEGKFLVSTDREYRVVLTPDAINNAIENKELIPSLLLIFITLSFYYGLITGGGQKQPTYLTQMKTKYIKMLEAIGEIEELTQVISIPTTDWFILRPTLAFMQDQYKTRAPATALDLLLYKDQSILWEYILDASKNISFSETINRILPSLYDYYYPDEKKEASLSQISDEAIEKLMGNPNKIPSWIRMG